ncbi:hypothetical protein DDB_G0272382 [Dictyostelium discoideum AX4]|uniref:PX domain-containing protein n=1 Tax=Dictyostelium discoideum TaxID=44689 RepID=Q55A08_DICDI|nr:hypothetical protein DDB_G0272382 [Dictyostelium discoideum AX4]EAL71343.1 hypothetical protein DDB_G0272382 [Dictyostelium discoideum AX4]|eukprot:XP_645176.1 hypothetical protein DDB_G0272382 [Dictyostelium discoideum AX4]
MPVVNNLNFEILVTNNHSLKFQCFSYEDKESWIKQLSVYTINKNNNSTTTQNKSRGISLPDVKVDNPSQVHHRNFNQSAPSLISVATNSVKDYSKDDQIDFSSASFQENIDDNFDNSFEGNDSSDQESTENEESEVEESQESDQQSISEESEEDEESEQEESEESEEEIPESFEEREQDHNFIKQPPQSPQLQTQQQQQQQQQQQTQPQKHLNRELNEDESFIIELFPNVEVSVILDAMDFCGGDRDEVIALLASQTRLSFQDLNGFSPLDNKRKSSIGQNLRQQQNEKERKQEQLNKEQEELKKELKKELKQLENEEKQFDNLNTNKDCYNNNNKNITTTTTNKQTTQSPKRKQSLATNIKKPTPITKNNNSSINTNSYESNSSTASLTAFSPSLIWQPQSINNNNNSNIINSINNNNNKCIQLDTQSDDGTTTGSLEDEVSFESHHISKENEKIVTIEPPSFVSLNISGRSRRSSKNNNNCTVPSPSLHSSTPSLPSHSSSSQQQQIKKSNWSYKPSAQSSPTSSNSTTAPSSLSSSQDRNVLNTSQDRSLSSSQDRGLSSSQDRFQQQQQQSSSPSTPLKSSQERPITPNSWKPSSKSGTAWDISIRIVGFFQIDDHIEYKLQVISNSNEWFVCRRYNNFLMLDKKLKSSGIIDKKDLGLTLPPKKLKVASNQVAKARQLPLQSYLVHLLSNYQGIFYNNNIVNVFLNSEVNSTIFQHFINKTK